MISSKRLSRITSLLLNKKIKIENGKRNFIYLPIRNVWKTGMTFQTRYDDRSENRALKLCLKKVVNSHVSLIAIIKFLTCLPYSLPSKYSDSLSSSNITSPGLVVPLYENIGIYKNLKAHLYRIFLFYIGYI